MWNCGPDVMDALLELIISLVCGLTTRFALQLYFLEFVEVSFIFYCVSLYRLLQMESMLIYAWICS